MRLACVQSNVQFGNPDANANSAIERLHQLKSQGVDLAVFPEAYLTGYCVDSLTGAQEIAIPRNHASIQNLKEAADKLDISVVCGFAERDGEHLYNTVALIEPGREPRFYQKTHLPDLGYDKFVLPGRDLPVFDTRFGRIGLLICFDLRPPEPSRVLSLEGADLIILPTNWPEGAEVSAEFMAIARAAENGVFFATCDRVGTENGFTFIGLSKIVSPKGKVLAAAGNGEEVITADIDLSVARNKRNVVIPGKYETAIFDSRRPELYGPILNKKTQASPGLKVS